MAFLSGLAALSCEVLWMRYLAFFSNVAYAFTAILGTFLLGLGAGSLLCRLFLARCGRPLLLLAGIELLLGLTILACFSAGALVYTALAPAPLKLLPMTAITVLLPTVLMGAAFPLICAAFTASVETVGRSIGVVYAVNTAGSIVGSLIPVFVLIPLFGIQPSLLLAALLYGAASVALFWAAQPRRQLVWVSGAVAAVGASAVAFAIAVPPDLCARVLLATSPDLGRHTEVAFYREGRTGTAVVLRDRVNDTKVIYINSTGEVPTTYDSMYCFKLMGILGPLLHPNPDEVLMICFGGGIAAGAAVQFPDVKSLEVVDLESSVVEAARTMEEENNGLLRDPKVQITIDDGRNYILTSRRNRPVIVTDSTHPKSSDSWVLYTREFYRTLKEHLAADGVLVQWLPMHNLSVTEYKVILRTFQSVFPHASLWLSNAVTETGEYAAYTLLVATANRLTIDLDQLKRKLAVEAIASDLQPYGLQSPVGVLDAFVCAEETLRRWTADGPTNTDDLPYTQYETRYSPGIRCTAGTFLSPMESVAPYLRHTGTEQETRRLHQELGLHMEANKLALMGKMKRAVALLPNDTRLRKCVENRELGKRYVRELAEYYPDDVPMLIYLGRKAETLPAGADDALALYRKALAIDAGNTRALNSLADLLIRRGALEEGVGHLRRVLDLEPDNAGALHNMGLVLSNLGRIEEAISYYKRALEVEPRHVKARCNLAVALAGRGRTDEAIAQLAEALRTNPYLADAHNNMGVFLA
ncbi:MAG: fused MFS/spermidine synthase, partial [Planctomycetota bacterium]